MFKKVLALILGVVMVCGLALAGCGGSSSDNGGAEQPAQGGADTTTATEYKFTYNGTEIAMKDPAAPILEALGEAKSYNEETSCAFDGLDKSYFYGSFYLYTYPQGEEDFVNMVELVDDTVETEEGISIGDSKEKVEEVYGADSFNGVNAYQVSGGEMSLTIIMDNDKVSSIQYAAIFE